MKLYTLIAIFAAASLLQTPLKAQRKKRQAVPKVHTQIDVDKDGYFFPFKQKKIYELVDTAEYTLTQLMGSPVGTQTGIDFNFGSLNGKLMFGFIPYGDSKHPQPVYFRRSTTIVNGQATIEITPQMKGTYDMVGWEESKKGTLGYRIADQSGAFLYDGIVSFSGNGPFKVEPTMVEGPFIDLVSSNSAVISFTLNQAASANIQVGDKKLQLPQSHPS